MNIIGKIYKTFKIVKTENGFNMSLRIKSNFGGIKESQLKVFIFGNQIIFILNEDLILEKEFFDETHENKFKNSEYNNHLNFKNMVLIKPDSYNLKNKNIVLQIKKKSNGVEIPIVLYDNYDAEKKMHLMIVVLIPYIYEKKEYIKVMLKEEVLPIKLITNKSIKIL